MRIGAGMDGDGHFRVALYDERSAMVSLLQDIHDGDYFYDVIRDYAQKHHLNPSSDAWIDYAYSLDRDQWFVFLSQFTQRGTFELLDI